MKVRENAVGYKQMAASAITSATNHNNKCDFINKNNDPVQESIESPNLLEQVNNLLKRTINTTGDGSIITHRYNALRDKHQNKQRNETVGQTSEHPKNIQEKSMIMITDHGDF
jgi:two-component SAPR family response regulator